MRSGTIHYHSDTMSKSAAPLERKCLGEMWLKILGGYIISVKPADM